MGGRIEPSSAADFVFATGSSARTSVIADEGAGLVAARSAGGGNGGRLSGSAFVLVSLTCGAGLRSGGGTSGSSILVTIMGSFFGVSATGVGTGGVASATVGFCSCSGACEPLLNRAPKNTPAQQSTEAVINNPIWVLRVTFRVPP
jgi:hypothetical protein